MAESEPLKINISPQYNLIGVHFRTNKNRQPSGVIGGTVGGGRQAEVQTASWSLHQKSKGGAARA